MKRYMLLFLKVGKPFSNFVKDNMTFKIDTDDDIPLNKVLKFDVVILL